MKKMVYPFTAIVGQEDFKLALLLNSIDPSIGGVLAVGDKGTGKTTLIRSLSALMGKYENFPFVNLPIGASEDRVLGHIHLEKLINEKKEQVIPGLLAKANYGCLYIDEVNLLNDYLMDTLLDATASGGYYLEREGLSTYLESKFCLIGSMNPEEGDLRPQLKDRFGLSVTVETNQNPKERLQIIKNRLAFDNNSEAFVKAYTEKESVLYKAVTRAKSILKNVVLNDAIYALVTHLVIQHKVEGHRADILLVKTARAYAAFLGEPEVNENHINSIKDFVLNHRSNSNEDQLNQERPNNDSNKEEQQEQEENKASSKQLFEAIIPNMEFKKRTTEKTKISKKGTVIKSDQGVNSNKIKNPNETGIDVRKTVSAYMATDSFELKHKQRIQKSQKHIIFLLDASGSMLKDKVIAYAKGVVQKMVDEEKRNTPLFSLVSIANNTSLVHVTREHDIEHFIKELNKIETGGKTDIIPAFKVIKQLVRQERDAHQELIMVTDGKFNSEEGDAFNQAVLGFKMYCKSIVKKRIIDAERGVVKLALAQKFAAKINADYEVLVY